MLVEAHITNSVEVECESIEAFRATYKGYEIDSIDNQAVIATCITCRKPIFEGQDYGSCEDADWHDTPECDWTRDEQVMANCSVIPEDEFFGNGYEEPDEPGTEQEETGPDDPDQEHGILGGPF